MEKTTIPEQNEANALELANQIILDMDIDGVYEYAIQKLTEWYLLPDNKEHFEMDYMESFPSTDIDEA